MTLARESIAVLVGGGDLDERALDDASREAGIRIAADGGALAFVRRGIPPDWLVGDGDSLTAAEIDSLRARGVRMRLYPHEKDLTDLEIALELACELGAVSAVILGATGSRLDHTLTNVGMLRRAAALGLSATIHAPGQRIGLLRPGKAVLTGCPGQALSLVPLTPEVRPVTTENLRFPLCGETLYLGRSRGIHNEFLAACATVSFAAGELLVFVFDPPA